VNGVRTDGGITRFLTSSLKLNLLPACTGLEELVNLKDMSLDGNRLTDLSTFDLGKLTSLRHLSMERNELTHFHPGLGTLTLLRTLNLCSNQLEEFPKQIGWIAKNMR
jgi:Leucine-rich repeat (LRR) protein